MVTIVREFTLADIRFDYLSSAEIWNMILNKNKSRRAGHIHFVAGSTIVSAKKNMKVQNTLIDGLVICDSTVIATYLNYWFRGFKNLRGTDFLRYVVHQDLGQIRHCFIFPDKRTQTSFYNEVSKKNNLFQVSASVVSIISENPQELVTSWMSEIDISNVDLIWIGLGSPKQDLCARDLYNRSNVPCIAIGAALQFYSGTILEAPNILISMRLEWMFRLANDFSRLWRRYTLENIQLIKIMLSDFVTKWGESKKTRNS